MPYPDGLSLHTIWEEITHFIDSTKDLLSLALTCHTFKELIIPDHLHYRNLSIDIRMTGVRESLERRPGLGRSVRSIKLSNLTETESLPPPLSNLTIIFAPNVSVTDTDIAFFKRAVSHMPLLKTFSWGDLGGVLPEQVIDIFHMLTTSAPYLEGLNVNLFDLITTIRDEKQMKSLSIWTLTRLKRVVLRTTRILSPPESPDAIQMILSCPNIEDLYSQATSHPNTFPFYMMQQANWTKLRRLEFQKLSLSNEEGSMDIFAIITSFFVRHSNIECLSFYVSPDIPLSTLPSSSLPKIRSLSSDLNVVTSLLSESATSRLVHLTCRVGTQIDLNALPQMDKLESLYLFGNGNGNGNGPDLVHPFLSKAPNLKKIASAIREIPVSLTGLSPIGLWNKEAQDRYTELFLKYPQSKLTHIYIVSPLITTGDDPDSVKLQVGMLCEKLSALRALKYVYVKPDYVELERDENGAYSGCHFISNKDAGGGSSTWGGFFSDL